MDTAALREAFLAFFEARGHRRVESAPLVPRRDPSLLFTNAGMVPFKGYFLGHDKPPTPRLVSAQRCLRAGGKHNDLDNVGYTSRHHTFFEMLGNFSFGDYFKERAIALAWEFLTDAEAGLGLNRHQLWVTVYGGGHPFVGTGPLSVALLKRGDTSLKLRKDIKGEAIPPDDEARELWLRVLRGAGFSAEEAERRVVSVPSNDNFWMMGDTGPCGPCSEIFYDRDPQAVAFRGLEAAHADDCVEVWNLVFMQYQRALGLPALPLPQPCVDTGMGLERIAAVVQGVAGNYDTELFRSLMAAVDRVVAAAGGERADGGYRAAHRVLADHLRAAVALVGEGVLPDNGGRGYVLRRILRRAVRHAHQLGAREPVLAALAPAVAREMAPAWPLLADEATVAEIARALHGEEQLFSRTLERGLAVFEEQVAGLQRGDELAGEQAFFLYDTFGFPLELTRDLTCERGLRLDEAGFEQALAEQRRRAQDVSHFAAGAFPSSPFSFQADWVRELGQKFLGDTGQLDANTEVEGLLYFISGGTSISESSSVEQPYSDGEHAQGACLWLVLNQTLFYAEGGGQVGDRGYLYPVDDNRQDMAGGRLQVFDTKKSLFDNDPRYEIVSHKVVVVDGPVTIRGSRSQRDFDQSDSTKFRFAVDGERRRAITANHSATHLLHAALRLVLGGHVRQRGSLVDDTMTRFDFSHPEPLSEPQWAEIECLVQAQIDADQPVEIEQLPREAAERAGALALFGEKYGDTVRVLSMGERDPTSGCPFSVELCGGTHVLRTGDIEDFCLKSEGGVAAGVRRVVGISGAKALAYRAESAALLARLAERLRPAEGAAAPPVAAIEPHLAAMQADVRALDRHCALLRSRLAQGGGNAPPPPAPSVPAAVDTVADIDELALLRRLGRALRAQREDIAAKLEQLVARREALRAEAETLRERLAQPAAADGEAAVVRVADTAVLALRVEAGDARALREAVDHYRERIGGIVFLAAECDGRLLLAAGVAKPLTARLPAGELLREFAARLGGKGGGRPDFAQGGGSDLAALPAVLAALPAWVEQRLLAAPGAA